MTHRERFLGCLLGEPVDRPYCMLNWGAWEATWRQWRQDGLGEEFGSFEAVRAQFNPDPRPVRLGANCGPCPARDRQILHEDDDYVTWVDGWGIKRRNPKANESMSQFIEFPVKSRSDWQAYRDRWLDPDRPDRLPDGWRTRAADLIAKGIPVQIGYYPDVGIFGTVRWLLGDEECLLAFYTDPALVHEIMEYMTDLYLTVWSKMAGEVRVDMIHIWEDMCGRQGPLISPAHWEEFMGPCYRRIKAFAIAHDIPIISVDTDGDPSLIIPPMMAAGVNYLLPMEVAAGCDVNEMVRRFPTLGMMGGIDKRALAAGPAAIDAELERIRPAMESGRYIPDLDHLVPSDVTYENYCYYARQLTRLTGKN